MATSGSCFPKFPWLKMFPSGMPVVSWDCIWTLYLDVESPVSVQVGDLAAPAVGAFFVSAFAHGDTSLTLVVVFDEASGADADVLGLGFFPFIALTVVCGHHGVDGVVAAVVQHDVDLVVGGVHNRPRYVGSPWSFRGDSFSLLDGNTVLRTEYGGVAGRAVYAVALKPGDGEGVSSFGRFGLVESLHW